jgi:hypothetical protein
MLDLWDLSKKLKNKMIKEKKERIKEEKTFHLRGLVEIGLLNQAESYNGAGDSICVCIRLMLVLVT